MNCDQVKSLLSEILDEQIADELIAEIRGHLADCPSCHVEVDTLQKTIRIYRAATPPCPTLGADAKKRLHAVLSYEYRSEKRTT
ncbi:MAG TPA: zf-HC2 domain-containing protein [Candidatus Eisenbacteria bacterium]|nr:zf-HC2 domain-containing protein [Candidatus Eisenbacteria bacterium]